MRKQCFFFLIVMAFTLNGLSQNIQWADVSGQYNLPAGVKLYAGERTSPLLKAWYFDVDMAVAEITIRPYLETPQGITSFTQSVGAYAAINGGFFSGTTSVSSVVYPEQVLAQNIASVVRSGVTYPLTRSFFGIYRDRNMVVDWVYHFDSTPGGIYRFPTPLPNAPGNPAAAPDSANGSRYDHLLAGIGGGPTLVENGQMNITYDEEVFWGSGVGQDNRDPRTVVGYTADNRAILLVADGRDASWSDGLSLPEAAALMIDLGCVEAMNLDGGGSTQMAIGGTLINRPEGGTFQRAVPSILAIVHADSLPVPPQIIYQNIIDTEDSGASLIGPGWFPSANSGYWGNTPAMLNVIGSGGRYAHFQADLPQVANYEVYAWWVAASNRSQDTPIIINHANGRDTVRVDQSQNGSAWQFIGSYTFQGDTTDAVLISNDATTGNFIVADAVRFVSYDTTITVGIYPSPAVAEGFELAQNYPNPFNPVTHIGFSISDFGFVELQIYDITGQLVKTLVKEALSAGHHEVTWLGRNNHEQAVASGIYFYQLSTENYVDRKKMILLR